MSGIGTGKPVQLKHWKAREAEEDAGKGKDCRAVSRQEPTSCVPRPSGRPREARKTDPNALTKQAAERALVRAKRARQMKRRTFTSGTTSETEGRTR